MGIVLAWAFAPRPALPPRLHFGNHHHSISCAHVCESAVVSEGVFLPLLHVRVQRIKDSSKRMPSRCRPG